MDNSWPKPKDLVKELIEQSIASIVVKDVDYYKVDDTCNPPSILYSKYCRGGSYVSVCRWGLGWKRKTDIILTEVITGKRRTNKGWELGSSVVFRMEDPEVISKMATHMRLIFDQNHRKPFFNSQT